MPTDAPVRLASTEHVVNKVHIGILVACSVRVKIQTIVYNKLHIRFNIVQKATFCL